MTNPDHEQRQDSAPGEIVLDDEPDTSPRDFEVEGLDGFDD